MKKYSEKSEIYSKHFIESYVMLQKYLNINIINFELNNIINSKTLETIISMDSDKFNILNEDAYFKVSEYKNLPKDFINENIYKLKWSSIIKNNKFTSEEIINYKKKQLLTWKPICEYQILDIDFIRKYENQINWTYVFEKNKNLPLDLIEKHLYSNEKKIIRYQKLPEEFIIKKLNRLDITEILNYQKVSEEFLKSIDKKYYKYINFSLIKVSEEFIAENMIFFDKKQISIIIENYDFSENFIIKYINQIDLGSILRNQNLSEDFLIFLEPYINSSNFSEILRNDKIKISDDYIRKNMHKIKDYTDIIRLKNGIGKKLIKEILQNNKVSKFFIAGSSINITDDVINNNKDFFNSNDDLGRSLRINAQNISEEFLKENLYKYNFIYIEYNKNISKKFINKYPEYLSINKYSLRKINHFSKIKQLKDFKEINSEIKETIIDYSAKLKIKKILKQMTLIKYKNELNQKRNYNPKNKELNNMFNDFDFIL